MKRTLALAALVVTLFALPAAHAENVPAYALDKDFENCMGGENPQHSPERAQYCGCVRDGMKSWDLDTYGNVALEQSKSHDAASVPDKVAELAKSCLSKVLH